MSGPRGQDPNQSWQPGQPADHSSDPTMAGSPWQQQPGPTQEGTWQAPAYTPQYQQPAEPAYPQQYPSTPGYGSDLGSRPPSSGNPDNTANTGNSPASTVSSPSTGSPGSPASTGNSLASTASIPSPTTRRPPRARSVRWPSSVVWSV
jgi:hypothetical protein